MPMRVEDLARTSAQYVRDVSEVVAREKPKAKTTYFASFRLLSCSTISSDRFKVIVAKHGIVVDP